MPGSVGMFILYNNQYLDPSDNRDDSTDPITLVSRQLSLPPPYLSFDPAVAAGVTVDILPHLIRTVRQRKVR